MTPSLVIASAWFVFAATHLIMSASGLRQWMTARYGPLSFTLLFVAITVLTLTLLIGALIIYGDRGVAGFEIENSILRTCLRLGSVFGAFLLLVGLLSFPALPMSVLAQRQQGSKKGLVAPSGIALISRHPFFVGLAILSACHIFLACTLAIAVFFAGMLILCALGIPMQDKKLKQRWGEIYTEYMSETSVVPFGKLVTGHPRGSFKDRISWAIGIVVAWALFALLHSFWAFGNGAVFLGVIMLYGTLGASVGILRKLKKGQRHGTHVAD